MGRNYMADIPGNFFVDRIGSTATIASNGAGAILQDSFWVAPANLKVLSAWRVAVGGNDVTKGTATTSASYRRMNILNGGADGTGTVIVASLNATASAAQYSTRAFATTANNTVSAGEMLYISHLTVGANTADGTVCAASVMEFAYELL